jgi:lauroyl/myristoyl acyltransferase
LNESDPGAAAVTAAKPPGDRTVSTRWTLHGLNNGFVFGATCRSVAVLPKSVSYAIGDAATWVAWRVMTRTRTALADNLRAVFPTETTRALEWRARLTLRAYARDVIDFLCSLDLSPGDTRGLFEYAQEHVQLFEDLLAKGQGIILVSGHFGNWELGSVAMRRVFELPLTIVAMAEENDHVNVFRRDIRERIGADTVEVRQSLDTALQIRKRLAANGIVAMLMDRHIGRDRVAVRFLGRQAWFLRTPALMAFLTGAPLVPCFIERIAGDRFRVSPGVPIVVSATAPREQAVEHATQQVAEQLETRIRLHPEYWYQFYRYWDAQAEPPPASP